MSAAILSRASNFYITGGTLRRDAPCYVARQADDELFDSLRRGEFCYVLTARQMGKSSLMVRTAARLREEGVGVATLDLSAMGQNLTAEQWYRGLLGYTGQQLELEDELVDCWCAHRDFSPLQRWMRTLCAVLLRRYPDRVVIFIDEVDAVRSLPFSADEFFAAIREFYNRRTTDEELERLTFCLLGVATPSDLIRDTRTTPFNIGRRIELHDFTEAEASPLAQGLQREGGVATALQKRILYWTGGHPYLTQRLCQVVAADAGVEDAAGVDRCCKELFFTPRAQERDDNLLFVRERMLHSEVDLAGLLHLYEQVQRHQLVRDDETNPLVSVLRLSGIARVEGECLRARNRIYARVFNRAWVKANLPDAEVRRQRAAFRRGLLRATAIAGVIIAVMALLVLFALRQRSAAQQAGAEALSRELSANAVLQLQFDPELSLLLAMEALRIAPTTQAEDALRQALPESHVQAVMRRHTNMVRRVVFSPDSRLLVTVCPPEQMVYVWEAATGRKVAEHRGQVGWGTGAGFSPDGRLVVTASDNFTAQIWSAETGRTQIGLRGHQEQVLWAEFSPDGKLVTTTSDDKTARVWEADTGKELIVLRGHSGRVWHAIFSPDGQLLVTAGDDSRARVWTTKGWQNVAQLPGYVFNIAGPRFSPDGKRVITENKGHTARVWDTRTGRLLTEMRGHTDMVNGAVFSPDGRLAATASADGTARLWDASTGRSLRELRGHTSKVRSIAFSPDGKLVATGSHDGTARVWEVNTGQSIKELRGHKGMLDCRVTFSSDGRWLATGSEDYTARVWNVGSSMVATELRGHQATVSAASYSPDGQFILTSSDDHTARLWEAGSGRSIKELRGHLGPLHNAALSPDGKLALTASADKTARVWELSTGRVVQELRGHTRRIFSVNFSPDAQRLVTASEDGTARVWETNTGRSLYALGEHTGRLNSAAFSPDGRFILTASHDHTARLWEAGSGRSLIIFRGHNEVVSSAAFSPDGKLVVTGCYDGTVRLWETESGRSLRELRGHKATVSSVAFSPDGQFVVAGSWDGTARVWATSTGQDVALIREHADGVVDVAFSPDGKYIVTASSDKTARIYACEVCRPIGEVLALARTRVTRSLTLEEREKYLHEPPSQRD